MAELDLGYSGRGYEQPPRPPFEGFSGGGGGGFTTLRPAARTWALPEHVGAFRTAQIMGRLAKMMSLGAGVGAAISPIMDFSQASWPGFQNDIGYQPKGLADYDAGAHGFDALVRPAEEEHWAPTVWVDPYTGQPSGSERMPDISPAPGLPDGSHIISGGVPVTEPVPVNVPSSPVWRSTQLEAALRNYEQRVQALNSSIKQMHDQWQRKIEYEIARTDYEAEISRIMQVQDTVPATSIIIRPDSSASTSTQLPIHVRLRYQEIQEERVFRRRRADRKVPPAYTKLMKLITATLGSASEVGDMLEALAWNMYALDARGRPVLAMVKWNKNMSYVFHMYSQGKAKIDDWGFLVDFAVNQWSDAAYAFQSREQDKLAFQLGWKAPIGITSAAHHEMRLAGENPKNADVSSQWVRSQSRWFRSQDVWRSQRVRSLFRRPA